MRLMSDINETSHKVLHVLSFFSSVCPAVCSSLNPAQDKKFVKVILEKLSDLI